MAGTAIHIVVRIIVDRVSLFAAWSRAVKRIKQTANRAAELNELMC